MRVGDIFHSINNKCKTFLPLIQVVGIFTGLLIVFFTYRYLNVTIDNIELYRKELLQQEMPILDFRIMNEKVDISIADNKFPFLVTKSIKVIQLNPRIRLNLVTADFPTRMRKLVRRKDYNIILPVFMTDSLRIFPPEFEWNTDPFFELIKHYNRNEEFEPNTQAYWFNHRIPISLTQRYSYFGEVRKVISIFGVDYDVFVDNVNNKASYNIELKNVYLIKTLESDENHIDILNSVFDSFADIGPLRAQDG